TKVDKMAQDDTEIEIKLEVDENTLAKLRKTLEVNGKFEKTATQVDEYFTPAHKNFMDYDFPYEWLSIRKRSGKTILNYKHFYPENKNPFTHCDEYDTFTDNGEQLKKTLVALNFRSLTIVEKKRDTYIYRGFEIAIDSVKNLGNFVEIEALDNSKGVTETRLALFAVAKELGLDITKTQIRGYPYLLMEKQGLIKKS
ncbi:MAG: class IV adenylate cyclase, partial [Candidatus Micrarchaeota archaeon]